ncbi:hypothetical protein [Streptomyces sp. NPDC047108]|uniref:hypothetical protein n=1 Tax=Streptomyces sp. NPDC047108 TaxID=3155025 RepID=UPI0033CD7594
MRRIKLNRKGVMVKGAVAVVAGGLLATLNLSSASAHGMPGWDAENPDLVGDCNGSNPYDDDVSPSQEDGCRYQVDRREVIEGKAKKASNVFENCTGPGNALIAITNTHTVTSDVSLARTHTVGITVSNLFQKVLTAGANYQYSETRTTSFGKATAKAEAVTINIEPGYKGWLEFRPELTRTHGTLIAEYGEPVGPEGEQHKLWSYGDVFADTPITENGIASGTWVRRSAKCAKGDKTVSAKVAEAKRNPSGTASVRG